MGDQILATIILFGGNFAPTSFAYCEGQLIDIASHTALFSLLGTTYGGNGTNNFALPDLRDAEKGLNGVRYIIAMEGIYPSRP